MKKKIIKWLKEPILGIERVVYILFSLIVVLDFIVLAVILGG